MTPLRQGPPADKDKNVIVDKDKNMLRACNGVVVPAADKIRTLPPGGEVCENKTRKKRPLGTVATRTTDGDREFKVAVQRLNNDSRLRHSNGPAFRCVLGWLLLLGSTSGQFSGYAAISSLISLFFEGRDHPLGLFLAVRTTAVFS